jgi:PAS domain S-box-containing protein
MPPPAHNQISFFAKLFRDSAMPAAILAPDSTVLFWNVAAERLFKWSSEEVLGGPVPIVPPDGMDEYRERFKRILNGDELSADHVIRIDKDHNRIEFSVSAWPIRDTDGRVTAVVGVGVDTGHEKRQHRESLIKRQLEQLELLYATAPIGLGFLDTDLRYVRVNERLAQINGLPAEAHAGKRLADVVPEVAASLEDIYREVIATGASLTDRELRAATPGFPGVQRDWQVSTYPLKDHDGTVLGVTFAVSDVTERNRLNDELRRKEMLLRLVIDSLPGAAFYYDRNRRFRFANRTFGEWFQRPVAAFEGRHIAEVLGDAAFELVRERLDRALEGEHVQFEAHVRYPDRERDVYVNYVPDCSPDGFVCGVVGLVRDLTEQKRAERSLRDSEERFRRMVEIAVEGIWIVNTNGKTTFVNDRMAAILGYSKEEMLGRVFLDFIDPEDVDRARLGFEPAKNPNPNPEPHEFRFYRKDGSVVWLDVTVAAMVDAAGLSGVLAMCTDVTERKHSEQRLRQAGKLESLGILAGGVAHDFNNLLTGIMGNASLVLQGLEPDSRFREMLQGVMSASEHAARLTRQLLTYAGRDQGKLQPLNMAVAARELLPLLSASIPKTVQISQKLDDGVPVVQANRAQLQQVMMNLVINAAESIPERTPGEIRIEVGRGRLQPEDYRAAVVQIEHDDKEYVFFSVTDSGTGMDAETQARIFDPFFTTKFHGRGLGLSAVLGIVKGHRGTLSVRSAPGRGSVFTVFLPASQDKQQVHTRMLPVRQTDPSAAGTILFVDDEPAVRKIAQSTLERHGYSVLLAENGHQAIGVLAAHPEVEATVLDLAMPVMSGDTAGPLMNSLRPDVPLILSSGYSEGDALARVGPNVVAAFLEKPYSADVLVAKVEEVLRARRRVN